MENINLGSSYWEASYRQNSSENKHVDEIGSSTPERALFQHEAVTVREDHIEQETESECTEETERRQQPPELNRRN